MQGLRTSTSCGLHVTCPLEALQSTRTTYIYRSEVGSLALNIRDPGTEKLAEELAKLTGETKTEAVRRALLDRLERLRRARTRGRLVDELDEIARRCARLPVQDRRAADDILGHDKNGLPS